MADEILSSRACGTCTLCCKVFPVAELAKPAGRWCQHVRQGQGCSIYVDRPQTCRDFYCQWRFSDDLGPEWKPEVARFVLSIYPGTNSLSVAVDPGTPAAWQQEPYLSNLRQWSEVALAEGEQVIEAVATPEGPRPAHIKDRIRALGPTVRPDLTLKPADPHAGEWVI